MRKRDKYGGGEHDHERGLQDREAGKNTRHHGDAARARHGTLVQRALVGHIQRPSVLRPQHPCDEQQRRERRDDRRNGGDFRDRHSPSPLGDGRGNPESTQPSKRRKLALTSGPYTRGGLMITSSMPFRAAVSVKARSASSLERP